MDDYSLTLRNYRLEEAEKKLTAAKVLIDNGCFKDAINRSYYAVFDAMRSVLAIERIDFKKHAQVIGYFNKNYIHTGLFDTKYNRYISSIFQIRNNCDYNDFYLVSKSDALEQYEKASEFVNSVKEYFTRLKRSI